MYRKSIKNIVRLFSAILTIVLLCNITTFAGNKVENKTTEKTVFEHPFDYVGQTAFGEVSGMLTWKENQVTSFLTSEYHYLYNYDLNGYRVEKQIYSLKDQSKHWTIKYVWAKNQVERFEFINSQEEILTVSGIYNEAQNLIGFKTKDFDCFFQLDEQSIVGLLNSEKEEIVRIEDAKNNPVITLNQTSIDNDLLLLIIMTIPGVASLTILDYESGIETTPISSSALIVKPPVPKNVQRTRSTSYQIIVYRYQPKGASINPFGHLDIRINQYGKHFSYADYDKDANFLIIKDSTAYLNHQSNYQTYEAAYLWVSNAVLNSVYTFFSFPIVFRYNSGNFDGQYWKITSGSYANYNLLSRNCSTIIRDALAKGYGSGILNQYSSNWSSLNTPNSVFGMVRYLEGVYA